MLIIEGKEKVRALFAEFGRKKIRIKLELTIHELEITFGRAFVRGAVRKTTLEMVHHMKTWENLSAC